MRAQWILLLCSGLSIDFVSASLRHTRRGTVAEHNAQKWPEMSMNSAEPNAGLAADRPESLQNVQDYKIAMPTPMPAGFNGVFCRGGACQYRVAAPVPTLPPPVTPPPLPIGGHRLSGSELCRGLGCISGVGVPGDAALSAFNLNCVHLFNDVGGGLSGQDSERSIAQVHESFTNVCKKRVGILEAAACPMYANTVVGAVSPKVNSATVGGTVEVCTDTYLWLLAFKQSEIDLKLTAAALPPKGSSLLAGDLNRFGTGGVGAKSPRGEQWRQYASAHGVKQSPPGVVQQLSSDGSIAAALVQTPTEQKDPPGTDKPEDTPCGLPKYVQNPAGDVKHVVPQSATKYQIAAGSSDGAVAPVEVSGDLFTYCSKQFGEIMMGFTQTAPETVKMTKGWCAWQASVSSWIGKQQEFGHPDWTHRTCSGMENLVSFSLQDHLGDTKTGLSAQQVCKNIFLAISAVHRTDGIVKEAWSTSLRAAPSSGIPAADDGDMKKLLDNAQAYASQVFGKLRAQKAAYGKLNQQKIETSAFDIGSAKVQAPPLDAPDLPNSANMDLS